MNKILNEIRESAVFGLVKVTIATQFGFTATKKGSGRFYFSRTRPKRLTYSECKIVLNESLPKIIDALNAVGFDNVDIKPYVTTPPYWDKRHSGNMGFSISVDSLNNKLTLTQITCCIDDLYKIANENELKRNQSKLLKRRERLMCECTDIDKNLQEIEDELTLLNAPKIEGVGTDIQ